MKEFPEIEGVELLYTKRDIGAIVLFIVVLLFLLVLLFCAFTMIKMKDADGAPMLFVFFISFALIEVLLFNEAKEPIYAIDITEDAKYIEIYKNFKNVTKEDFYWEVKLK